jgi:hypothetical protein
VIEHVEGSDPARVRLEIPTAAFNELTQMVERSIRTERARMNAYRARGAERDARHAQIAYHALKDLHSILMGRDPTGGEGGTP